MYTIRCDAKNFILRKSHKKVIKNFNNFIKHGTKPAKASQAKAKSHSVNEDDCSEKRNKVQQSVGNLENVQPKHVKVDFSKDTPTTSSSVKQTTDPLKSAIIINEKGKNTTEEMNVHSSTKKTEENKPSKKKFMRRQKLIAKIVKRQSCTEEEAKQVLFERAAQKHKTKTLEDFLSESSNSPEVKHVFTVLIKLRFHHRTVLMTTLFLFEEKVYSS